jgi:probable HAF family extracellular repeat protein
MRVDARHATSFVATDMGTLGDGTPDCPPCFSEAFAVNDKGLVVGRSATTRDPNVFRAFVWSPHTGMNVLETLKNGTQATGTAISNSGVVAGFGFLNGRDGPFHAFVLTRATGFVDLALGGGSFSGLTAINARGDVVGFSDSATNSASHAFLWTSRDGIQDLGTLDDSPGSTSTANAINDHGVVVGESTIRTSDGVFLHAFMWTPHAGMVDLGTLGGSTSSAQGVSDDDVVVGFSHTKNEENHAFVWTRQTRMVDIGTEGGQTSFGEKINGRFVIGHKVRTNRQQAFVWTQKHGFVDLGPFVDDTGSLATGVNDRGVVIGNSFNQEIPASMAVSHAFVWSASSGMILPLDSPDKPSTEANAINGDFIVGSSCDAGHLNCHATLWKPAPHSRKDRDDD